MYNYAQEIVQLLDMAAAVCSGLGDHPVDQQATSERAKAFLSLLTVCELDRQWARFLSFESNYFPFPCGKSNFLVEYANELRSPYSQMGE